MIDDSNSFEFFYKRIKIAQRYIQTIPQDAEYYLTNLLHTAIFNQAIDLETPLCLQLAEAEEHACGHKYKQAANNCVIMAGLFPERLRKRTVNKKYAVGIGSVGYSNAANYLQPKELYSFLANNTEVIVDLLEKAHQSMHLHAL